MSTLHQSGPDTGARLEAPALKWLWLTIVGVMLVRMAATVLSPVGLGPDEAQYWRWGNDLAWGYWSKPPLIGWVIHASTAVFGDAEWAIRIATAPAHALGAVFVALSARHLYRDDRIAWLAGLGYLLMPGVTLSSLLMSTDGLLLPLWAGGLYALARLRTGDGRWVTAVGLGLAIGFGLLAKYAMSYFLIGLALACVVDGPLRRSIVSLRGAAAGAIGAALFAPHMSWNAANSFKTVSHTADNANLGGELFNPDHALKFLTDQMGVFGPVAFLALLAGLVLFARRRAWRARGEDRMLLCFVLPPLVIILGVAVLSRAHANWAATAYPAASILVPVWLVRLSPARWPWFATAAAIAVAALLVPGLGWPVRLTLAAGLAAPIATLGVLSGFRPSGLYASGVGLQAVVAAAFVVIAASPTSTVDALGLSNALKRTRAWPETVTAVADKAREVNASAILVDERENWHGLDYYKPEGFPAPIRAWRCRPEAKSFSEEFPLIPRGSEDDRVLVLSDRPAFQERMSEDFAQFEPIGTLSVPLGGGLTRDFDLFLASGFDNSDRLARQARGESDPC